MIAANFLDLRQDCTGTTMIAQFPHNQLTECFTLRAWFRKSRVTFLKIISHVYLPISLRSCPPGPVDTLKHGRADQKASLQRNLQRRSVGHLSVVHTNIPKLPSRPLADRYNHKLLPSLTVVSFHGDATEGAARNFKTEETKGNGEVHTVSSYV